MENTLKRGDQVRFWSNKVFGVPVPAKVLGIKGDNLRLSAYYNGVTWIANVPVGRLVEEIKS